MDREDSFQALMNLELERDEVEGGGLGEAWLGSDGDSDEENIDSLERNALRSLCSEMMEEVFDESSFPLNSELDGCRRKGKSHAKSCLKKLAKLGGPNFLGRCANERNFLE
jgi:hypothetical protein